MQVQQCCIYSNAQSLVVTSDNTQLVVLQTQDMKELPMILVNDGHFVWKIYYYYILNVKQDISNEILKQNICGCGLHHNDSRNTLRSSVPFSTISHLCHGQPYHNLLHRFNLYGISHSNQNMTFLHHIAFGKQSWDFTTVTSVHTQHIFFQATIAHTFIATMQDIVVPASFLHM